MAKLTKTYRCRECGATSARWAGRCPHCAVWDALVEETAGPSRSQRHHSRQAVPVPLTRAASGDDRPWSSGVGEFDRVLGGGLVPGSVTVLGGEPGAGKSTLLLQVLAGVTRAGGRALLVTAEESMAQVRARADRVGAVVDGLTLLVATDRSEIIGVVDDLEPDVVVIDSIQTIADHDVSGVPGSVTQVRECTQALVALAKLRGTAVVLVGHVTKDGDLAGPRALEHLVDTVLAFDGDRHHALRMLRVLKHRFGPTDVLGLLEMSATGLVDVDDPSELFLADRRPGTPGSAVAPILEGARPLLVEVQALVGAPSTPVARRSSQGFDSRRLAMLLAVVDRRTPLELGRAEVFVSVTGGLRVTEPGADLAVVLALTGAALDVPIDSSVVAVGEVGLGGEVRQVAEVRRRLSEAARLGFTRAITPAATPPVDGLELFPVATIADALSAASGC